MKELLALEAINLLVLGGLVCIILLILKDERESHRADMDQMTKRLMASLKADALVAEIVGDEAAPKPVTYVDDDRMIELAREHG
jgi:hypothetical protein